MENKELNTTKNEWKKMFIILPCLVLIFFFIMFAAAKFNLSALQVLLMISGVFAFSGIIFFINRVAVAKESFSWLKFFCYFAGLSVCLPLIMIALLTFLLSPEYSLVVYSGVLIVFFAFALTLKALWYSPKISKELRLALLFSLILTTFFIFLSRPELLNLSR